MAVVAMKQLLEAGVHFGHQTRRWDPRMAEYIFQARNGIHIIDLQKTSKKLDEAYAFLKEQAEEGKTVLFVGTKKQAQDCMKEAAEKCGMYYVNQRWLGGMLTNFATIEKRIERLNELEKMQEDGTFDVLPKKEVILLKKEMEDSIPNWNKTVTKSQKWAAGAPGAIEADVTVNENGGTSVIYPSTDTFKAYMAESGSSTGTETTSKPENKDKKDGE